MRKAQCFFSAVCVCVCVCICKIAIKPLQAKQAISQCAFRTCASSGLRFFFFFKDSEGLKRTNLRDFVDGVGAAQ